MAVLLLLVVALGVAVGVAWGVRALVVYAFFVGIPAVVGFGLWIGGGWLQDASAGRWRRRG